MKKEIEDQLHLINIVSPSFSVLKRLVWKVHFYFLCLCSILLVNSEPIFFCIKR